METEIESPPPPHGPDPEQQQRVTQVLARIKAAVQQRQAERATVPADRQEARLALLELRQNEFVREPVAVSPRPVLGRLLVFLRKASYHLFFKWHARAVLAQQNAFNAAAARLVEELVRSAEALGEEVAHLSRRLAELEGRARGAEGETGETGEDGEDGEDGEEEREGGAGGRGKEGEPVEGEDS